MKSATFVSRAATIGLGCLLCACISAHAAELQLTLDTTAPKRYERVELVVTGLPAVDQPFDPEQARVDLEVTGPSGERLHFPGFYYQAFDRQLHEQQETLTPHGDGEWRIRWLPLETGAHTLRVTAACGPAWSAAAELTVDVAPSAHPGLARVESQQRRYLQLDDGTPLFLNGLCACWHGSRGTYDYDDWLAAYEKAGINYIRIWMWPIAFGIEWDRGDRLNYRLDNAWRLDHVLAEAERRGVYVMLCLDYHGMFQVKPDYWGSNNFWPSHPYNTANGGPCATQNDFFTSDAAKALYEKRLRYIVARWSAYRSILAWEFFNEIDNVYEFLQHDDVVAWHADMGRRLRALDPCRHLISSSFTGGSKKPDLFALPEMEFAQYHSYNERHPAQMMAETTAEFYDKYHKPFFVSEYGTDWRGWKPDTDPHFRALHQAIWSGAFAGACGTGMPWWWEEVHRANLYPHWAALAAFLEGTGIGRADMRPAAWGERDPRVIPFGMAADDEALVWFLDQACNWPEGALDEQPTPLADATVTLQGVADGTWSIEWWDPHSGTCVARGEAAARSGALQLLPPAFQMDIAGRLKKQ